MWYKDVSHTTALIQRNFCGSLLVIFFCLCRVYHVCTSACFSSEESSFSLVPLVFVKDCRTHLIFVCAGPRLTKFKWKLYRFSQSRYSCIASDWVTDTLCISYLQQFETFLLIYYIFNEMKWNETLLSMQSLYCFRKNEIKHALIFVYAVKEHKIQRGGFFFHSGKGLICCMLRWIRLDCIRADAFLYC